MSMNREQKRMLQRQGQVAADGTPTPTRRGPSARPAPTEKRTGLLQFFREVNSELRKVTWPSRKEVRVYSLVTLMTLVFMIALIFGLDYVFSNLSFKIFK